MKILPQTLALALLPCLLAACGGGGGDDNSVNSAVNSPRDELSAQEKQAFEASQVSSDTMNWSGDPEPFRLTVAGKTIQDATADAMRIDGRSLPALLLSPAISISRILMTTTLRQYAAIGASVAAFLPPAPMKKAFGLPLDIMV